MLKTSPAAPQALSSIKVVDLGAGMAAAIAVKLLADAGAQVTRFEPEGGDPFYDLYPAYPVWHAGKTVKPADPAEIARAVAQADVCVTGGEDHPELGARPDAAALRRLNGRAIILDLTAAPEGVAGGDFPAVEILAQARSGIVFEQFSDRPLALALPVAAYGSALQGVIAALAGLWNREENGGGGETITASMLLAALRWCASIWVDVEHPPKAFHTLTPKNVVAFRLQCSDGLWVHLSPNVPGGWDRLYKILGVPGTPPVPGSKAAGDGPPDPRTFFGDRDLIAPYAAKWTRPDLLAAMAEGGLPGEAVLRAGEPWDDAQVIHNGLIETGPDGSSFVGSPVLIEPDAPAPAAPLEGRPTGGPLSGLKVIDFGCFVAGPHASVLLSDLGADVIKLERIGGDPLRAQFHHFAAANRGKRSISVDAKAPEGQEVIRRLCASADLVHHNFRPGVSARMGIDRETLKAVNPDIIVLESSAYGPTGPKAPLPGFDTVFQAACGLQPGAGGVGNEPLSYRWAPIDYSTGVMGAVGMMLALHLRRTTGRGSAVWSSLLNTGVFLLSEVVRGPDGAFAGERMSMSNQLGNHPAEALYQAADGWIAIAARGEAMARRLTTALGLKNAGPLRGWDEAQYEAIAAKVRALPAAEALARLKAADVWATACAPGIEAVLADPKLHEIGGVLSNIQPGWGAFRQIGSSVRLAGRPATQAHMAEVDSLGGHSREILAECGYASAEIDDLIARQIVA